jgi:hypothetical protein
MGLSKDIHKPSTSSNRFRKIILFAQKTTKTWKTVIMVYKHAANLFNGTKTQLFLLFAAQDLNKLKKYDEHMDALLKEANLHIALTTKSRANVKYPFVIRLFDKSPTGLFEWAFLLNPKNFTYAFLTLDDLKCLQNDCFDISQTILIIDNPRNTHVTINQVGYLF